MHNLPFEEAFPIARDLARRKAIGAVGRCGLTLDDCDDVASQLEATFYVRFGKFDGGRASIRTYASRVMDTELASLLRYRMVGRRRCHVEEGLPGDAGEMADSASVRTPTVVEQRQFWIDVERALAPFPRVLLDTAQALCWHTPSDLSRVPGQSRTVVYRRMRRLRSALLAAGIGPSYFSPPDGAAKQRHVHPSAPSGGNNA
jgi:DNA-directed RNA polymerase specialized sigma24 family protein